MVVSGNAHEVDVVSAVLDHAVASDGYGGVGVVGGPQVWVDEGRGDVEVLI